MIGIDSNADNLQATARKAQRKPAKGGLANVVFGQMALEQAPGALAGLADSLTVFLPWGHLLQAVARPDVAALERLRRLGKPGAPLRVIFGYDPRVDAAAVKSLGLPPLTEDWVNRGLTLAYARAGWRVRVRAVSKLEVGQLGTTWAKKLTYSGQARGFVEIRACLPPDNSSLISV